MQNENQNENKGTKSKTIIVENCERLSLDELIRENKENYEQPVIKPKEPEFDLKESGMDWNIYKLAITCFGIFIIFALMRSKLVPMRFVIITSIIVIALKLYKCFKKDEMNPRQALLSTRPYLIVSAVAIILRLI